MVDTYGPYSAGLAGAFIDKQFETHGVGHALCYYISNRSDLVLPYKTARFPRQAEGETRGWVLIAFLEMRRKA
jgi:hypothetical protein